MPIETTKTEKRFLLTLKLFFIAYLVYFAYKMISGKVTFSFLDNANLMFHEAGHVIFNIFWEPILVWGGTIMQLLVPLIFVIAFILKKDFFATGFSVFWFGENFLNISYYVADARAQEIPLVAGEHDWAYLLGRMNLLQFDQEIGRRLFFLGSVLMILGLLISFFYTFFDCYKNMGK